MPDQMAVSELIGSGRKVLRYNVNKRVKIRGHKVVKIRRTLSTKIATLQV